MIREILLVLVVFHEGGSTIESRRSAYLIFVGAGILSLIITILQVNQEIQCNKKPTSR